MGRARDVLENPTMVRAGLTAVLVSLAGGCVADPAEGDGTGLGRAGPEEGYPAVGTFHVDEQGGCTATLVTPSVLISAQHCVYPLPYADTIEFRTGPTAQTFGAQGVAVFSPGGTGWDSDANDFVAIALDRVVEGIAPLPLRTAPVTRAEIGRSVVLVGYGRTAKTVLDAGQKRSGPATIVDVEDDLPVVVTDSRQGPTVCFNDSGGPLLLDGVVLGVLSNFAGPVCLSGGRYTRVDRYLGLVEQAKAAAAEYATNPQIAPRSTEACGDLQDIRWCPPDFCTAGDAARRCDACLMCADRTHVRHSCTFDPDCGDR
jgi:trypsin